MLFGVPHGSILGPFLFITFMADFFFTNNDIDFASYVDDITPYVYRQNITNITKVFKQFHQNGLIGNFSTSHFLISPY